MIPAGLGEGKGHVTKSSYELRYHKLRQKNSVSGTPGLVPANLGERAGLRIQLERFPHGQREQKGLQQPEAE